MDVIEKLTGQQCSKVSISPAVHSSYMLTIP